MVTFLASSSKQKNSNINFWNKMIASDRNSEVKLFLTIFLICLDYQEEVMHLSLFTNNIYPHSNHPLAEEFLNNKV